MFDSLLFTGLSVGKFRVWARKNYGFVHGHADHPRSARQCRCFGLRRKEGQRGNDRRGQDRGHAQEGAAWRADRVDREGGRGLGAHGPEVREDG